MQAIVRAVHDAGINTNETVLQTKLKEKKTTRSTRN